MAEVQTISVSDLMALTGLTDRRHRQLAEEGYFTPPIKGQYRLAETLKGLFKYFREDRHAQTKTMAEERLRKVREEADRVAIENANSRNAMVDKADFLRKMEPIYTEMRQRILNSSMMVHEKDALLGSLSKLHEV